MLMTGRLTLLRRQHSQHWPANSTQFLSNHIWLFAEIDKLILKFMWECKRRGRVKIILKMKNKVGGLTRPDFRTCCKAAVNRTVWRPRKESVHVSGVEVRVQNINPHVPSQLIFDKEAKMIQRGENSLSTNGTIRCQYAKKMKSNLFYTPHM